MSKQPKALRLADFIEEHDGNFFYEESSRIDGDLSDAVYEASYVLRSQHALIGELVEALEYTTCKWRDLPEAAKVGYFGTHRALMDDACATLSKAKEQQ